MGLKNRDPFEVFNKWLKKATRKEVNNPNAMTLATVGKDGRPSARMVLLKDVGPQGFTFYTNLESPKSRQLAENPYAALLFHWKTLDRQIRIEGAVEQVSDEEADAYFATRPRTSQLGAWASHQSQAMDGWADLEKRLAMYTAKFHIGPVPRPEFWSGFRLHADRFEFWKQGNFRLHKRFVFTPSASGSKVGMYSRFFHSFKNQLNEARQMSSSTKQWGRRDENCLTGTRHKYIPVASSSASCLVRSR